MDGLQEKRCWGKDQIGVSNDTREPEREQKRQGNLMTVQTTTLALAQMEKALIKESLNQRTSTSSTADIMSSTCYPSYIQLMDISAIKYSLYYFHNSNNI